MEALTSYLALPGSDMLLGGGLLASFLFFRKSMSGVMVPLVWVTQTFMQIMLPTLFGFGRESRVVFALLGEVPVINRFDISNKRISDFVMAKADAIKFDARALAEQYWTPEIYTELYQIIRPGLEMAHFYDGKLPGGYDKTMLIDNIYSRELHVNAIKSGLDTAAAVALGFFIVVGASEFLAISVIDGDGNEHAQSMLVQSVSSKEDHLTDMGENNRHMDQGSIMGDMDHPTIIQKVGCFFNFGDGNNESSKRAKCDQMRESEKRIADQEAAYEQIVKEAGEKASAKNSVNPDDVLETWGSYQLVRDIPFTEHVGNAKDFAVAVVSAIFSLIFDIAIIVIASVAVFLLAGAMLIPSIVTESINNSSQKWRIHTKDALNRYRLRLAEYFALLSNHRKAINVDKGIVERLGPDLIELGRTCGTLGNAGSMIPTLRQMTACLDMESIFTNIAVLGATGVGKSTACAVPLFKRIARITNKFGNRFGALCLDAKGVLWKDLKRSAEKIGRGDDVVLIGFNEGMSGIDPLANLMPDDVAAAIRSVMGMGGESKDAYWADMAEILINNIASLVYALSRLKKESDGSVNKKFYTLSNIYYLMSNEVAQAKAIKTFMTDDQKIKELKQEKFDDDYNQIGQLRAALVYLSGEWATLAPATKTGILSNAAKIFNPIYSNPKLATKFSAENEQAESIARIFDGKLFMLSISPIEHNTSAKLMQVLVKTSFYKSCAVREIRIGSRECQKKPVFCMIDEAQAIVTTGELGEAEVLNRSRSSGLAVILISQGLAAYYMKMGREAANNMLQQCRTSLILQLEDLETHDYYIKLAGQARRAMSFSIDAYESMEYLYNVLGYDFFDYSKETAAAAEYAAGLVDNASIFRKGTQVRKELALHELHDLFTPDQRFTPTLPSAFDRRIEAANLETSYAKETTHRAEDAYRTFLAEGNEMNNLLSTNDFTGWGRFNMLAVYQRAGIMRMDIIECEHDYT